MPTIAPEIIITLAGTAFVLGYLLINQTYLRVSLLVGTAFYIWYYAIAADTPLWEAIDAQIGTVLMAVPARDLVIFLDGDHPGSAENLRALLAEISPDLSYPVSDLIYEWREGAWSIVR